MQLRMMERHADVQAPTLAATTSLCNFFHSPNDAIRTLLCVRTNNLRFAKSKVNLGGLSPPLIPYRENQGVQLVECLCGSTTR